MQYLLLLIALNALISDSVDLPILASLGGLNNADTAVPTPNSPFSWSDAHPSCSNNNPTIDFGAGFCTLNNDNANSYLQVDLGEEYDISSVGIVGRGDHPQHVTSYNLQYSTDGENFIADGINNPLQGNTDQTTEVRTAFERDIEARYLRIIPVSYSGHKSFRFEAYGEPANPECRAINIDQLLLECSPLYRGLNSATQNNANGLLSVNNRINNLIQNSASFYQNDPDAPAAAKSVFGGNMDYFDNPNKYLWFNQNKDYLLILSLIMNLSIIIFGSILCLKAGVCTKACGNNRGNKYKKVKVYTSGDDDENQIIVNNH